MVRLSPWNRAVVLLSAAALLAACGASPTDTPSAPTGGDGGGLASMDEVYAAVEGQTGQERFDTLLALAKEEEAANGPLQLYHSGDYPDEIAAFQEATGLGLEPFNSTAERVAERVNNEFRAGQISSSVMITGYDAMSQLHTAGAIADLNSPLLAGVADQFKGEEWVSALGIMLVPGYNSDRVAPEDVPTSWEDFFTNFEGRVAVELTGWKWFGTLVTKYFVEQKGMTEEAAIDLITDGLHGSFVVDGNTLMANLLASGQYDFAPSVFAHHLARLQGEGAPVTTNTAPDMPPFLSTTGMALTAGGPNPAAGLLFIEFMLSDTAQQIIAGRNYVPSVTDFPGTTLLDSFPNAIVSEIEPTGNETALDVQEKWTALFEEMVREAGSELVEE